MNSRSSNRCITKSCPHYASDVNVQTQQEYTSHYMVKHKGAEVKAALTMPMVEIHVQTQQEYRSHYMVKHDGVEVKAALTRSVRAMYRNMPAAMAKIQVCTTSSVATARLM